MVALVRVLFVPPPSHVEVRAKAGAAASRNKSPVEEKRMGFMVMGRGDFQHHVAGSAAGSKLRALTGRPAEREL